VHPDLSLPVHRSSLLRLWTAFHHSPTLADSQYAISSSVDVERFRIFVNSINDASFDIADENINALSSLAAEFSFTQSLSQI
jgi:hypothetical protein